MNREEISPEKRKEQLRQTFGKRIKNNKKNMKLFSDFNINIDKKLLRKWRENK